MNFHTFSLFCLGVIKTGCLLNPRDSFNRSVTGDYKSQERAMIMPDTSYLETRMKHLLISVILSLALIQPLVESVFIAPLAVGAAIGAVALAKGLIVGGLLARGRSRRTTTNQGRSYRPYRRSNHNNYGHTYAKPTNTYYYSSNRRSRRSSNRNTRPLAKRFAPEELPTADEIERFRREVDGGAHEAESYWLEMLEKDQDDCFKMLLCETFAKKSGLTAVETVLREVFGGGNINVDVSKATAMFDMAALTGARGGVDKCHKFYKRCDTPVPAMMEMIVTELEEFNELTKELESTADKEAALEKEIEQERDDIAETLIKEDIIRDKAQMWS